MTEDLAASDEWLDDRSLSKLKWRCRRGLLENDILIERFFDKQGGRIALGQVEAMQTLMALADNDLLELLMRRREPDGPLDTPAVHDLLALLRPDASLRTPPVNH